MMHDEELKDIRDKLYATHGVVCEVRSTLTELVRSVDSNRAKIREVERNFDACRNKMLQDKLKSTENSNDTTWSVVKSAGKVAGWFVATAIAVIALVRSGN